MQDTSIPTKGDGGWGRCGKQSGEDDVYHSAHIHQQFAVAHSSFAYHPRFRRVNQPGSNERGMPIQQVGKIGSVVVSLASEF